MVIAVQETTIWKQVKRQPNHVYLMDGTKAVAYIPWGEGKPFYFKQPLTIDRRGRKFVELAENPFDHAVKTTLRAVQGSKGQTYWVDDQAGTCTCPGFTFRGQCKHVSA